MVFVNVFTRKGRETGQTPGVTQFFVVTRFYASGA